MYVVCVKGKQLNRERRYVLRCFSNGSRGSTTVDCDHGTSLQKVVFIPIIPLGGAEIMETWSQLATGLVVPVGPSFVCSLPQLKSLSNFFYHAAVK